MRPHQGSDETDGGRIWWLLGLGGQPAPPPLQAVGPDHCGEGHAMSVCVLSAAGWAADWDLPTPAGTPPTPGWDPSTFFDHANSQALLEAAELAAVPPPLIHGAVLVGQADVLGVLLHRALRTGKERPKLSPGHQATEQKPFCPPPSPAPTRHPAPRPWGGAPGAALPALLLPRVTLSILPLLQSTVGTSRQRIGAGGGGGGPLP